MSKNKEVRNKLNQLMDNEDETKKVKKVMIQSTGEIVERIDKKLVVEDGRSLLND